ncbi:MAG: hypothetical protein ACFFD5_16655 [Candidatus Thorarchaeota archaeon]
MSSNLFPYKFGKGQWYKADNINENDLAVIVDPNRYNIWFFEGSKSAARDRSNARELLGELQNNYPQYEFKEITDSAPFEVLEEVEKLKEMSYIKGFLGIRYNLKNFSRLYFYLNYGGAFLLIVNMILLTEFILASSTIIYNSYQHFSIIYNTFLFNINLISILILCSFLVFLISALLALFLKKFKSFMYSFAASIFSFMGFFILRIWDIIIYYEQNNSIIFIRKDVLILLIFDIQLLLVISMVLGFLTGLIGIKLDKEIKYLQELKE